MGVNRGFAAIVLTVSLLGCGGGTKDRLKLAPAAGVAKFKGSPIKDATVTFYPEKGPPAVGRTDAEGKFAVKTNGQLGTVVGKNKVTVIDQTKAAEVPPADGNAMKYAVAATYSKKYLDPSTTDLIIDITPEGNKELVLDLTP